MQIAIVPFDMAAAGDAAGFARALRRIDVAAIERIAVLAKVEGTATLNDASRELAADRLGAALEKATGPALARRAISILSVGCEGIVTPGGWIVAVLRGQPRVRTPGGEGLVVGMAASDPIPMAERASRAHVDRAAAAVREAMRQAELTASQVALVLVKSPVLLPGTGVELPVALRRHVGSTGASRGAAALGAGIALGEIKSSAIGDATLCADWSLASDRTMSYSGTEVERCEAVVFGHRAGGDPRWRLDRAIQTDLLDRAPLDALAAGPGRPVLILHKAGIARDGRLRGERTTVLTSELAADKQLRAAASGVVGLAFGTGRVFVSGGAEHQAQPGNCIAAVVRSVR